MIVHCADERSQHEEQGLGHDSAAFAFAGTKKIAEENAKYAAQRKAQVGSGERNERIRTYNFPQNRVTDHRIELTLYNLPAILEGDIDPIIEPLMANDLEEKMAALEL